MITFILITTLLSNPCSEYNLTDAECEMCLDLLENAGIPLEECPCVNTNTYIPNFNAGSIGGACCIDWGFCIEVDCEEKCDQLEGTYSHM